MAMVACWVVGSHLTRATDNLSSTQFATHDTQDHANLPLISWHATPGDVIAFAGETVSDNATMADLAQLCKQTRTAASPDADSSR